MLTTMKASKDYKDNFEIRNLLVHFCILRDQMHIYSSGVGSEPKILKEGLYSNWSYANSMQVLHFRIMQSNAQCHFDVGRLLIGFSKSNSPKVRKISASGRTP